VWTSLRLLVLVVDGRRVRRGPVVRAAPALNVAQLMFQNDHRLVGHFGAAD